MSVAAIIPNLWDGVTADIVTAIAITLVVSPLISLLPKLFKKNKDVEVVVDGVKLKGVANLEKFLGEVSVLQMYLSYAHVDRSKVEPIAESIKSKYVEFVSPVEDSLLGDDIREAIIDGIECSNLFLCFVTDEYLKSRWCMFELKAALEKKESSSNYRVVPVKLSDVSLPSEISDLKYLDVTNDKERGVDSLIAFTKTLARDISKMSVL